jgi:hypothetical protein
MSTIPLRAVPQTVIALRPFDFFRVIDAQAEVKVSEKVFRTWQREYKDGPKIYRMNKEKMSFGRYSEVEQFILNHSELMPRKVKKGEK